MKLAEALIERATLQRRLTALKERMVQNAQVREGETAAENPEVLVEEYNRVAAALMGYIRRINATNMGAELEPGMSLTDAIALRDVLRMRQGMYADLANAAVVNQRDTYYAPGVAVRKVRMVDVAAMRQVADELAQQARELDTRLQGANWAVDLV